jgi:hypothetical protein
MKDKRANYVPLLKINAFLDKLVGKSSNCRVLIIALKNTGSSVCISGVAKFSVILV